MDRYAEWDTEETIRAVESALAEEHQVTRVVANDVREAFHQLELLRPDIVFNMVEGLAGINRESQIPALLEALDIPYTGSDPLTLSICLDKSRAKEILSYHGIPTSGFQVVSRPSDLIKLKSFPVPAIVKPLCEGSSKGISNDCLVKTQDQLLQKTRDVVSFYREPALVEEFLPGREFTVAMLGNELGIRVLPLVEICFDALPAEASPIYSFEAKWLWDTPDQPRNIFRCPADVDAKLRAQIEDTCKRAFRILRCRDWCRIDVRLDSRNRPNIIELNPLPGILPKPEDNSCFPKAARCAGMSYPEMVNRVLEEAWSRYGRD
ncbi:MAG: D-alanine--D-alanine ligase [Candidatus Riflebacteria bacterium]|nr:D-alanine--D-alanine ligase [Candidatus Riflebacteria bacterium]